MADTNETVADIIAAMRGGTIPQHRHDRELLRHYADRFGLHGFVLWRIRRAYERAVDFNMIAQAHNRRERKERRRLEAMGRR